MAEPFNPDRRIALATLAVLGAGVALPAPAVGDGQAGAAPGKDFRNDWDPLLGRWNVRHRKRRSYTDPSAGWHDEFGGVMNFMKVMDGQANVDDYVIEQPTGTYRAASVRAYDVKDGLWSIWWLDSRYPMAALLPPVRGSFTNGEGTFFQETKGDDGKLVVTRFRWTRLDTPSPRWEQAMSFNGRKTWDLNWAFELTRPA